MKKILVAGAGHGGLTAAAKLAKNGFDVTVFEKASSDELGHDWEDRFTFDLLESAAGKALADFPEGSWRFRGDCAFISPSKRKKVIIKYNDQTRQKVMWRKPLLAMLVENAEKSGVKFNYSTSVTAPLIKDGKVCGLKTSVGDFEADLVIDSAGVFSPVRMQLPSSYGIEKEPKHGDLFYAYRAYFNKLPTEELEAPFEVYMYHEGEQGLSWFCTNDSNVDVLIGRIDKLTDEKVSEQLSIFKKDHPWLGEEILHGGKGGIIPVRRPLTLMVGDRYAAIGDAAFTTMQMNGMGIDLSLEAGILLAETVIKSNAPEFTKEILWKYNRDFHFEYGGDAAKNEGLKNAILSLPKEGVDFLFESEVIQAGDLAGAGRNTSLPSLLGKFVRGMKAPGYFFALIGGLIKGSKASKLYKSAPEAFSEKAVKEWSDKISSLDIRL